MKKCGRQKPTASQTVFSRHNQGHKSVIGQSGKMYHRNIPVTYVTIRQLQVDTLLVINSQGTKARNIPVTHVTIRQLTEDP